MRVLPVSASVRAPWVAAARSPRVSVVPPCLLACRLPAAQSCPPWRFPLLPFPGVLPDGLLAVGGGPPVGPSAWSGLLGWVGTVDPAASGLALGSTLLPWLGLDVAHCPLSLSMLPPCWSRILAEGSFLGNPLGNLLGDKQSNRPSRLSHKLLAHEPPPKITSYPDASETGRQKPERSTNPVRN